MIHQAVLDRIEELCKQRGISINKLGTRAGVSNSTIKSMFYGKSRNPGIGTLKKLCDGLEISIVEFFNTPAFLALQPERVKEQDV